MSYTSRGLQKLINFPEQSAVSFAHSGSDSQLSSAFSLIHNEDPVCRSVIKLRDKWCLLICEQYQHLVLLFYLLWIHLADDQNSVCTNSRIPYWNHIRCVNCVLYFSALINYSTHAT